MSPILRTTNRFDFKYALYDECQAWPKVSNDPQAISSFNSATIPVTKLNIFAINAAISMIKRPDISKLSGVIVSEGAGCFTFSVQQCMEGGDHMLCMCTETGQIIASIVDANERFSRIPTLGTRGQDIDLSCIYAAILPCMAEKIPEIKADIDQAKNQYSQEGALPVNMICRIADDMCCALDQDKFPLNMEGGNIPLLSKAKVRNGACKGEILYGSVPKILFGEKGAAFFGKKPQPFKDLMNLSEFSEWRKGRNWSEEERKLIPAIDPDFPVAVEVQKMAMRYLSSRKSRRSMNNFLWRGTSGLGKSTGTEVLAALLGMPLVRLTCFSTMETQDFLTSFVPCSGDSPESLPSEETMEFDPENAYMMLTGERKIGATREDCKLEVRKLQLSDHQAKFKLVESNFIRGLEKGYLVEVQEMSRIKDQGVPVGLNEYDRPYARIPKADGSFTQRHPDALVVYTDNIGYSTVHEYDPAVLRRMSFVLETREIREDQAKARIKFNLGFQDEELLSRAYEAWRRVKTHLKEAGIENGICTINELEMFCQLLLIDGDDAFDDDFLEAVIYKATSDEEEQKELKALVAI